MSNQTNLPIAFDSFYAAGQETEITHNKKAQAAAFIESIKDKEPTLYRKLKKQQADSERERLRFETLLNTPAMQAEIHYIREWSASLRQEKLINELTMLGLDSLTTKRDIRNAYRRKARKLHPDVGGDAEAFKQLHMAYRTLLKEAKP